MLSMLIFMLVPMLPLLGVVVVVLIWKRLQQRDRRRSPLNLTLHNLPGQQLRQRIDALDEQLDDELVTLALLGPFTNLAWLGYRTREAGWTTLQFGGSDLAMALLVVTWFLLSVRKIARIRPQLRQAREGLAAELAVAQYLTAAAENGYPVLHDLPADGFNIDHVVIGHSAVFAIETKSRKKPEAKGKASARVVFDGKCLKFPEHIETKPLDQARAQARWLADYLKGELGHPIKVVPVLALPGWYVDYTKEAVKSDVLVQNPKVPVFVGWERFGEALGEQVRARVRFGLGKRYA